MPIQRPKPGELLGPLAPPFMDEEFRAKHPNLCEALFVDRYADGQVRVTSTISLYTDGTALKAVLNDRDNNRSAFYSEPTWAGLWERIESDLTAGRVEWKMKGTRGGSGGTPTF